MTSRRSVRFSQLAQSDIDEILQYTFRLWGAAQLDRYVHDLQTTLDRLEQFPMMGRARDELLPRCRAHSVGEHIIFYRVDEHVVFIFRVLHSRADASGFLEEFPEEP